MSFKKVGHQEISWFDNPRNSSGGVGARLSTDASTVRSLVGDALALIFQNIVAAGLVIAFTANWLLAIIILLVLPLSDARTLRNSWSTCVGQDRTGQDTTWI